MGAGLGRCPRPLERGRVGQRDRPEKMLFYGFDLCLDLDGEVYQVTEFPWFKGANVLPRGTYLLGLNLRIILQAVVCSELKFGKLGHSRPIQVCSF